MRGRGSFPDRRNHRKVSLRGKGRSPLALFFLLLGLLAAPTSGAETGVVEEVVDGDTMRVRTAGSAEAVTVRLIGIDAPERSHPSLGKEYLSDEAASVLSSLCRGKTVRMEKDAEDTDRYDRLLRYVFLPPPDGRLLNGEMLRAGMARAYTRFPFSRKSEFVSLEDAARREGKGLWNDGGAAEARWLVSGKAVPVEVYPAAGRTFAVAYKGWAKSGLERGDLPKEIEWVLRTRAELSDQEFARKARERGYRPVDPSKENEATSASTAERAPSAAPFHGEKVVPWEKADRHEGEEIVVEGTIVRAHRSDKVLYLNFHPNWKRYLTLVLLVKDLPLFPADPVKAYKGKKVRVRGEVIRYKGRLEMGVRDPANIVIVP
jgi:micrococcal nuclease